MSKNCVGLNDELIDHYYQMAIRHPIFFQAVLESWQTPTMRFVNEMLIAASETD